MSNVIIEKSIKCIEWTVKTPDSASAHVSKTFLFQYGECNLKLTVGCFNGTTFDTSHLYFNYCGELKAPINLSVRVFTTSGILNIQAETVENITTSNTSIWRTSNSRLLRNSLLTFKVVIYSDDLKEDKSNQTASYLNDDISRESLQKDFSEFLDTGLNQDVEMKCRELSIKAHKTVLCARSNVFRAMFRDEMQEGKTGIVEIQDMDPSYFRDFVEYMYTDILPELTFDKAKVLYEAGDKYNVKSLMLRCSEYFQDTLTPENYFQCFTLADAHSDLKLKDKIITYILVEKVYLQGPHWLPFYENFPKVALEVYKLSYEKK